MGLVFAVLVIIGVVLMVRSLRANGCFSFVLWVLIGLAATWFVLQFTSGSWRV